MSHKTGNPQAPHFSGWTIGTVFGASPARSEPARQATVSADGPHGCLLCRLLRRCLRRGL